MSGAVQTCAESKQSAGGAAFITPVLPLLPAEIEPDVIIPMVLQIRGTMVLQRLELEEKASSSHFWFFESFGVLMGKHGFAEKLHSE